MGFFNFSNKNTTPTPEPTTNDGFYGFAAPFLPVGKGNLALPYVNTAWDWGGYVPNGSDNLYSNYLRQAYHTSPLHRGIVDFTVNATVGGGYEFLNLPSNGQAKVDTYKFEFLVQLKKLTKRICKDAIVYESIHFLIKNDENGVARTLKRIPQDELRWDKESCLFTYCEDFSRRVMEKQYKKYEIGRANFEGILTFRLDDEDLIYPVPAYATANNWIELDGQSGFLHKSNIYNSVFLSTVFKFPFKPKSEEEAMKYKKTIENAKGAHNAGRSLVFFEEGLDMLPTVDTLNSTQNDKLFLQTDERTDTNICRAHTIDPILMGIRVSGKLGSGTDIEKSYTIWEKNKVMPLRSEIEDVINFLMDLFKVKGEFKFKNFQIVGDIIKEQQSNTTT